MSGRKLPTISVECPAPDCRGGLWRGRKSRPCFVCRGAGRVDVVAKTNSLGGVGFYVRTAKGTISKTRFEFPARLTRPLRRFNSGATTGGGRYCFYSHTDAIGSPVGIYAVTDHGEHVAVALPHGGFSVDGERDREPFGDDDQPNPVEFEFDDPEHAAFVESARESARAAVTA